MVTPSTTNLDLLRTHALLLLLSSRFLSQLRSSSMHLRFWSYEKKVHAQGEFNHALPRSSPLVSLPLWRRIRLLDGIAPSLHPRPCRLSAYGGACLRAQTISWMHITVLPLLPKGPQIRTFVPDAPIRPNSTATPGHANTGQQQEGITP